MNEKQGELFLLDQVPMRERSFIPTAITAAHEAVNLLVKNEQILSVQSALDNKGRLVSWAVDRGLEKLIENGHWPFDYRWVQFARPTGQYLEIRTSHAVLTVSQVEDPDIAALIDARAEKPNRPATYRKRPQISN